MLKEFLVGGMRCEKCAARVQAAVEALSGVKSAQVFLDKKSMRVDFDEGAISAEKICAAVQEAGFDCKN